MGIEYRRKSRTAFIGILMLFSAPAMSQIYMVQRVGTAPAKGYGDIRISKSTIAGQPIRLWWATLLNPDCTAGGTMTTEIVSPPRHGQATISDDKFYPEFIQPNPRAACDVRKVPGKQAFYTATTGFRGHDKVIIRNATSEGRMRRIVVDIDVR